MRNKRISNGITLIALVITIVILLILAGVTIATLKGDNGILTKASEAEIMTIIGAVKEEIDLERINYRINQDRDMLLEDLYAEGKVKRTIRQEGENYYLSYVLEWGRWKETNKLGKGNPAEGKDIFVIDDNFNLKYIAVNGKEYGGEVSETLLEDTTIIRFRSPAFAEYIKKKSGAESIDKIEFQWMKNQTSLTITDTEVDSLEDLVFFPNLINLTLGEYGTNIPQITTLEGIQNCTKLESLSIIYGPDKDYSAVSKLSNLKIFSRFGGTDTDYNNAIDGLKDCNNLKNVTFRNCFIMSGMSRIGELGNLEELNLSINSITKIEGLEKCTNLRTLNLDNNKISKIENLENLLNLESIDLSNNQITDILELDKNNNLVYLSLLGNPNIKANRSEYNSEENLRLDKIQEIITVRNGVINVNVEQLKLFNGYKKLTLSSQNLTTLECLEGQTELTAIDLRNNKITLADEKSQNILKSMQKLNSLTISNNPLETLKPINELKKIGFLDIGNITNKLNLAEIEDIISQITIQGVKNEDINTILNCNASKVTKLTMVNSRFDKLPDLSRFTNLNSLSITSGAVTDVSIVENLSNLTTLVLNGINLNGKLPNFTKLTKLTKLSLTNNYLNSSDIENLKVLKNNNNLTLDLRNNSIIDASSLLEFNTTTKILLNGNINLSKESKEALKEKFGNNVSF